MVEEKRRVFLNSITGAGLFGGYMIMAFFLSPILIRGLGNREYGIWEIALSFLGYFRVLDLGLGPALVRHLARAHGAGDRDRFRTVHHSALSGLVVAALLNLAIFAVVSRKSEGVFNVAPGEVEGLSLLVLLAGVTLSIQLVGISASAFLQGLQRHYQVNGIRLSFFVLQSAGYYWVVTTPDGPGVAGLAVVMCLANAMEFGVYGVLAFLAPESSMRPWSYSGSVLRELYAFGLRSLNLMVADRLRKWSMPLVIAHVVGVGHVVFFTQPAKLVDYALAMASTVRQPLMPYFSSVSGGSGLGATGTAWTSMSRALQAPMMWAATALFFLGAPFLTRWLGPEFGEEGLPIIRLLAVALFIEGIAHTAGSLLVSLDRHGLYAKISLVMAVLNLGVAVLAARAWGLPGVALSLAATNIMTSAIALSLACREVGITPARFLRDTAGRLAVPLVAAGATFLVWDPPVGYAAIVGQATISGLVYLLGVWFLSFHSEERRRVRRALGGA